MVKVKDVIVSQAQIFNPFKNVIKDTFLDYANAPKM